MNRAIILLLAIALAGCNLSREAPQPDGIASNQNPPPVVVPVDPIAQPLAPTGPDQSAQVFHTVIRAQSISGEPDEVLYRLADRENHVALSDDGRYLFFALCEPCDERRLYRPHAVDLTTDSVRSADEIVQRWPTPYSATWAGDGFWIEPLVHLGVDGSLETSLRQRLVPAESELIAAAVSPGGGRVAAVIRERKAPHEMEGREELDLLLSALPEAEPIRIPRAVAAQRFDRGFWVELRWSPDSQGLVLCAEQCHLIDVREPEPGKWRLLPDLVAGQAPVWAPDGRHLLFPGVGVVDTEGTVQLALSEYEWVWNQTGSAVLLPRDQSIEVAIDGRRTQHSVRLSPWILGWLPDGRVVTAEYETPASIK